MKTTRKGDFILNASEAKVLLNYLNKQKAKVEDMDFTIDNIRVILIMNEASPENHHYNII